jgi:hypothetical protein
MGKLDWLKKPAEEVDELGNVFCNAKSMKNQYG